MTVTPTDRTEADAILLFERGVSIEQAWERTGRRLSLRRLGEIQHQVLLDRLWEDGQYVRQERWT